jgi:hypothetical protein
MEVCLQPEKEAQLAQIAAQRGVTTEELAREIVCGYLEGDKASAKPARDMRRGLGTEISAIFSKHGLDVALESPFDPPKKAAGLRRVDSRGRLAPHKSPPHEPSRSRRKKRA